LVDSTIGTSGLRHDYGPTTHATRPPDEVFGKDTQPCTLHDQVSLELRDSREHRQKEAGHRIATRPDIDTLGHRHEPDAGGLELPDVSQEVKGASAEAVELPHENGVDLATLRSLEYSNEPGTSVVGPAPGLARIERYPEAESTRGGPELRLGSVLVLIDRGNSVVQRSAHMGRHMSSVPEICSLRGCPAVAILRTSA
jgi:hypothetical protein